MTCAPDYTEPVGQVRLLIADTDTASPIYTDQQIQGFLAVSNDNIKRAAARALRAIAISEVLISKVIRTQDLSTNGAAVANALNDLADKLDKDAEREDDGDFFFDIVPTVGSIFGPELVEDDVNINPSAGWGIP